MKRWKKFKRSLSARVRRPHFARNYLVTSVVILLVSTVAWAWVGSLIQLGNADQLANTFIAQQLNTALLPDQHTFLLKLPFFWLVNLLGATPFAFCFVTILLTLITVGLFALFLYKIEKRPFYIGTLFLALALVLLMIPAQSYAGANLPVNMAMLTTRNLEYIVYITALALIITSKKWRSPHLLVALFLMILLVASDKLFLSISLGASVILFGFFIIRRQPLLRTLSLKWFAVSVLAAGGSLLLLFALSSLGILHSVGQGSVGPYGLVSGVKNVAQAIIYGVLSLFTNFGANPGYDGRTIPSVLSFAFGRLAGPLVVVYILTLGIFAGAIVAIVRLVRTELKKLTPKKKEFPFALGLTLGLVASTFAAFLLFIASNHYYPVDARYVGVALFAGFVAIATYGKTLRKQYRGRLIVTGVVLVIGIFLSSSFVTQDLHQQTVATQGVTQKNTLIAQALKLHHADTLLGDYWRVMPIKLDTQYSVQVVDPLSGCTSSRSILNNAAWTKEDTGHSFAYLLTLDAASANFPACTLQQVTDAYGRPDSSVVISGTQKDPQELLLFFEKGIHKTAKPSISPTALTDTVLPAPLASLAHTDCTGEIVMNIVAHEDDDILFMNPDVVHEIQAGDCLRTIYMTAGDAGSDGPYWIGRQKGAEAAYAAMLGLNNPAWTERQIEIAPGQIVTIANPRGNHKAELVFMHLPDGSPNGQGFSRFNFQSLQKLSSGVISSIGTVDSSESGYTSDSLVSALQALVATFQPTKIQTQSTQAAGRYVDHSDHTAVGHYVQKVVAANNADPTKKPVDVVYYLGYPMHALAANLSDEDITTKMNIFMAFSQFDPATCHDQDQCDNASVYGAYLRREYPTTY